jgi:hypothetical protein
MRRALFAALVILVSFSVAGGGGAQNLLDNEPVWTMEFIKVKHGMFGSTLGYLDDNWMRVREEAKRRGIVLGYNRVGEEGPDSSGNIVLLTEFKNQAAYDSREKLFALIREELPSKMSFRLNVPRQEDLYETSPAIAYKDYSDTYNPRLQLLSKTPLNLPEGALLPPVSR